MEEEEQEAQEQLEQEEEQGQQQETEAQADREPGGSDGDAVRARKEYRARKRIQAELQAEREKNIRMEERLRALEEQRQQKPAEEKTFTFGQLRRAVDEGEISQEDADNIWERQTQTRIRSEVNSAFQSREAEQRKLAPAEKAANEIEIYKERFPDLLDPGSERRAKVKARFDHYVNELGYEPTDIRTEFLAIRDILGPTDKLKTRNTPRDADNFHAETPSNGELRQLKKDDLSGAPPEMVNMWNALRVPEDRRKQEFALYQKKQAARRAG